jgi:hypothetical protein
MSDDEMKRLPREKVLGLSPEEKVRYFHLLRVSHRKLEEVGEDLIDLLSPFNDTNLLALVGATGVGKTAFAHNAIRNEVLKRWSANNNPAYTPYIYITAPSNGDRSFSWAAVYRKLLAAGDGIDLDKKQIMHADGGKLKQPQHRYSTLAALREALDSMCFHRRVKVIVIDEAFFLTRFGGHTSALDTLRSLADTNDLKIVLLGSYDLFDIVCVEGQGVRRTAILHFERYKDIKEDKNTFKNVIKRLQDRWPCKEVPALAEISDELMTVSLGLVGLAKMILVQLLIFQLANNGKWDPRYLVKAAKSVRLLEQIRSEIAAGEEKIATAVYGASMFNDALHKHGSLLNTATEKLSKLRA